MIERRVNITPRIDFANHLILLEEVTETLDLHDIRGAMLRGHVAAVVNLRDKAIRDALICLGWRPPAQPAHIPDVPVEMRTRASDPVTSMVAAEKVAIVAKRHSESILAALNGQDLTVKEIAPLIGLTYVQVARRMGELQKAGLAHVVQTAGGQDLERDDCRVWHRTDR
jgi:hypothetical protein